MRILNLPPFNSFRSYAYISILSIYIVVWLKFILHYKCILKILCVRAHANGRNIVGQNTQHCWAQQCCDLLRPFAWNHNNVGTCCVQFETGQTFDPTSPNISVVLWQAKRTATMLRLFAWDHNNVGHVKTSAYAPCNTFFQKTIAARFLLSGLL